MLSSSKQLKSVLVAALSLAASVTAIFVPNTAQAIEQPKYTVVKSNDIYEIRKYEPYIVAEVVVPGPESEAGGQAFRLLGGYIFGKNKGERKLEMTAPVVQTPVTAPTSTPAASTKIEMTAPVVQTPTTNGFLVQFMMPSAFTLATLPEPSDAKVKLREVEGKMVAAHTYSGGWSQSNYDEHLNILKNALAKDGVKTQGEALYSRYNGPMTPWFLRKNEIWFTIQP
jgi:SOUL heme-binding protein